MCVAFGEKTSSNVAKKVNPKQLPLEYTLNPTESRDINASWKFGTECLVIMLSVASPSNRIDFSPLEVWHKK